MILDLMPALRPLFCTALLLGLPSAGVSAQESAPVPAVVEAASDASLPTGYRSVTWGATPDIVQGIRGRVMESLSTPDSSQVHHSSRRGGLCWVGLVGPKTCSCFP